MTIYLYQPPHKVQLNRSTLTGAQLAVIALIPGSTPQYHTVAGELRKALAVPALRSPHKAGPALSWLRRNCLLCSYRGVGSRPTGGRYTAIATFLNSYAMP